MSMTLFFALAALAAAVALALQSQARAFAIGAAAVAGVQALLYSGLVSIHVPEARLVAWAVLGSLGVVVWLGQKARVGSALATTVVFCAVVPLAITLQFLR